jgi:hypothetical protein
MDGMVHGEAVAGTFWGHGLPGSLFLAWAAYWAALAIVRGGTRGTSPTLESGMLLPVVKVVLTAVGVWIEIPGQGWYPQDVMMNWQHVTMYSVFGLTGVVDLLARSGRFSSQSTFVAYAAAMGNAGFLFWGHSSHGGVEGTIHAILALVFFAVAAIALVETVRPSGGLVWGRIGTQVLLGGWFIVGAWIIYRSGWDLSDPVRNGWTYTIFSWTAVAAAAATLAVRFLAGARSRA